MKFARKGKAPPAHRAGRVLGLLAAVVVLGRAGETSAAAGRRVALMSLRGEGAADVEKALREAFLADGKVEVVAGKALYDEGRRIGYSSQDLADPFNLAAVAAELGIDAIVRGAMARRGERRVLSLTVLDGGTGDTLESLEVTLRAAKMDRAQARGIVARLLPAIRKGRAVPAGGSPGRRRAKDRGEGEVPPPPAPGASVEDVPTAQGAASPPVPVAEANVAPGLSAGGFRGFEVGAGVMAVRRSFLLDGVMLAADSGGSMRKGQVEYETSTPYLSLLVDGEVWPFFLGGNGEFPRDLGLAGHFATSVGLTSTVPEESGKTRREDTSHTEYGLAVLYRFFPFRAAGGMPARFLTRLGLEGSSFRLDEGTDAYRVSSFLAAVLGGSAAIPVYAGEGTVWAVEADLDWLVGSATLNEKRTSDLGARNASFGVGASVRWRRVLATVRYRLTYLSHEFPETGGDSRAEAEDSYHGFAIELGTGS